MVPPADAGCVRTATKQAIVVKLKNDFQDLTCGMASRDALGDQKSWTKVSTR